MPDLNIKAIYVILVSPEGAHPESRFWTSQNDSFKMINYIKKITKVKLILPLILFSLFLVGCEKPTTKIVNKNETKEITKAKKTVTLILNFGDGKISTYSGLGTNEKNVLSELEKVTKEKKIELKVKKYSFGSLVEQINDDKNSKDKAWIYFVNGKSGNVGADKMEIKSGDIIEWKFIKPIF